MVKLEGEKTMSIQRTITYFEEAGKVNTEKTLRLALARGKELGVAHFVVASHTGFTARRSRELLVPGGASLIVVGSARQRFSAELAQELGEAGHRVLFWDEGQSIYPELVARAYRKLSEGMKVAVQMVAFAVDQGVIPPGRKAIAIAGTGPANFPPGGGADTSIVITSGPSDEHGEEYALPSKLERGRVHEIICKPL
jgi:hypothetical protein